MLLGQNSIAGCYAATTESPGPMMRAVLVGLLILSVPSSARAGERPDECRGLKLKTDDFTGTAVMSQTIQSMGQFTAVSVVLKASSEMVELQLGVVEFGALEGTVPAGLEIPVLFADKKVMSVPTGRSTQSRPYVSGSSVVTLTPFILGLDAKILRRMVHVPVAQVRLPLSSGPWDWKLKKRSAVALQRGATCAFALFPEPGTPWTVPAAAQPPMVPPGGGEAPSRAD